MFSCFLLCLSSISWLKRVACRFAFVDFADTDSAKGFMEDRQGQLQVDGATVYLDYSSSGQHSQPLRDWICTVVRGFSPNTYTLSHSFFVFLSISLFHVLIVDSLCLRG